MSIPEQAAKREWNKRVIMTQNNGFLVYLIHRLRNKLEAKKDCTTPTHTKQHCNRKWVNFMYRSPSIHKVTNLFKHTNLKIAFRPTNTVYWQLSQKPEDPNPSGIYQPKFNTYNNAYIGQSGKLITVWQREHLHYIRNNNPTSAYAMHILDNRHEFGSVDETLRLLRPCTKGATMNCWEVLFMRIHHKCNILISEQRVTDTNPLFDLA